jgi:hypothetical protein
MVSVKFASPTKYSSMRIILQALPSHRNLTRGDKVRISYLERIFIIQHFDFPMQQQEPVDFAVYYFFVYSIPNLASQRHTYFRTSALFIKIHLCEISLQL